MSTAAEALSIGFRHQQAGQLAEAERAYRRALELDPHDARIRVQFGQVLYDQGMYFDAEASFRLAVRLAPNHAAAHTGLGSALQAQHKFVEARAPLEIAVALDPKDPKAHNNLANSLREFHMDAEAEAHYREAIRLAPDMTTAYGNLGALLTTLGRYREAVDYLSTATQRNPQFALAFDNYVVALRELDRLDEAIVAARRAIELTPDDSNAHNNLGACLKGLGRLDEAIECYRTAIRIDPSQAYQGSNLVYALNFHPAYDPATIFAEHRAWARAHADPLTAESAPHANDRTPGRRLRVGYVSAHFRRHAVNFFVEPILATHDHSLFEVFCYASVALPDDVTQRLSSCADHWCPIMQRTDEEVSRQVREDQIDILVDLSGHIASNRLLVFARKPAPVQVTYIGYQNTTGMKAMDYRLTDAWADPPGTTDEYYTEKLVRLPRCFFCYQPTASAPPVNPLPALTNGHITFGSFNNFAKVTPDVLASWARILHSTPRARLVILASATPSLAEYITRTFTSHGIGAERVTLADHRPRGEYLKSIQQVDIALDPFPFNGHTTTCDALWQGIPVVTLAGRMYANRFGASAHVNLGLADLIAQSPDEYLVIAARLAGDVERLAALRAGLRERMAASPLLDFVGFTRNLEAAYRKMWVDWCGKQPT